MAMSKLPTGKESAGPAWLRKLEGASGKSLVNRDAVTGALTGNAAVVLLVDCSGSMAGDKMRQAQAGALDFGRDAIRRGYAVGVVRFGSTAETLTVPSRHESSITNALGLLRIEGSTNMAAGIDASATSLGRKGSRVICLVTDGMPDSTDQAIASAAQARAGGIEIMAVGTDDADWAFLARIVSRKELATKVDRRAFGQQIVSMAKMLPQLPYRKS
jgi:Mg-chelatase subunit ChlD